MTTGDLLSCAGDYHPVDVAADQHHGGLFWQARQKVTREADCLAERRVFEPGIRERNCGCGKFPKELRKQLLQAQTVSPSIPARRRACGCTSSCGGSPRPPYHAPKAGKCPARLPGPLQATTSICLVPSASASLNAARTSLNAAGCLRKTETSLALNLM
jgi:hypothetical protein